MNKSTILAVVVCIVLAAVAVSTLKEKPERGITRVSFANIATEAVSGIVVEGPNPVELRKTEGVWQVAGKRADESVVKGLLQAVTRIESSDLVTNNPSRFAELQVEGEKAVRVRLEANRGRVAEFVVGTTSNTGTHLRVDDAVYLVDGLYPAVFSRTRAEWLDRTLFNDEMDDVKRVEIKLRGQARYALVRGDNDWQLEDPSELPEGYRFDQSAARSLVRSLISARAQDISDEEPEVETSGLTDEADTFVYTVGKEAEAVTRTLVLGADGEGGGVYARVSTRDDLLIIPGYLAGSLRKTPADLRDLTLMSLDANAVQRLELKDGDRQLVFEKTAAQWKIAESSEERGEDFEFDSTQVERRIRMIGRLRAIAEAEGVAVKESGLDEPLGRAAFTLANGDVAQLDFGDETIWEEGEAVYVRGNADERIYLIRPTNRDGVLGGLETFQKREVGASAPTLDPAALRSLPPEVRESLLRQMAEQQQQQRLLEALKARQAAEEE